MYYRQNVNDGSWCCYFRVLIGLWDIRNSFLVTAFRKLKVLVAGQKYWGLNHFAPEVIVPVWFGPSQSLPLSCMWPVRGGPLWCHVLPASPALWGPVGCILMRAVASGACPSLTSSLGEALRLDSTSSECRESSGQEAASVYFSRTPS